MRLRSRRLLLALSALLLVSTAQADTELRTFLDLDHDATTGCAVTTPSGTFAGAEEVVTTTLSTLDPAQVTGISREVCNAGTLQSDPGFSDGGGWAVGVNLGDNGFSVVESYTPLDHEFSAPVRVGIATHDLISGGEDDLLTSNGQLGGGDILIDINAIPALGPLPLLLLSLLLAIAALRTARRGGVGSSGLAAIALITIGMGIAWAAIVRDGNPGEWLASQRLATDPLSDASASGADIASLWAVAEGGNIEFRVDIDLAVVTEAAPELTSIVPANSATEVATDSTITLNFSEPVNIAGGALALSCDGNPVSFSVTPTLPGPADQFILTPDSTLPLGGLCTVTVSAAGVTDDDSYDPPDNLAADVSSSFTVTTIPAVIASVPTDSAEVASDSNVTITFNKAVDVTATWFAIVCSSSGTHDPGNSNVNSADQITFTLDPSSDFSAGESCTATIYAAQVSDQDLTDPPDQPSADYTFGFTIDAAPAVTATTPAATENLDRIGNLSVTFSEQVDVSSASFDLSCDSVSGTLAVAAPSVAPWTYTLDPSETLPEGSCTLTVIAAQVDDSDTIDPPANLAADVTVVFNVVTINDAPSFTKGPDVTVNEDSGAYSAAWATAISAGSADETGQTLTFIIDSNDNPALFASGPAVDASGTLTFTPAADANGSANITLSLHDDGGTANGGSDSSATQSFVITITPINDAPSFTKGADQTLLEDAGAQNIAGWATAISAGAANEASQTLSFQITNNSNAALFASAPAVDASGALSYTPAADANGSATITLLIKDDGGTSNGGVDSSASQSFTIAITAVNDAPSYTSGGNVAVLENSGAYSAAWASAISAGPSDESGQVLHFNVTGNTNPTLFAVAPSVALDGTLSFTPTTDLSGSADITVTLSDDGGTANGGSDSVAHTFTITVNDINTAPSFTSGGTVTVDEDSGAYSATWATAISPGPGSESSQVVHFNITGNTDPSLFSVGPTLASNGTLSFTVAADAYGSTTLSVQLVDDGGTANGGVDTSATQNFTITVTSINDAPSFSGGGTVTVDEDSGSYNSAWASAISAGPANESGQSLSFSIDSNNNPALFSAAPSVAANGNLSFTPAANASGSANIAITLHDNGGTANGGSDTSSTVNFTITVNPVNDPPSFTAGGNVAVDEDSGAYSATWATAISAGPGESQTISFIVTNDNNALFSVQPAISSTGTLTFTPAANAFGSATVSVSIYDTVDTVGPVTFTLTVNPVNDPPVAGSDTFEAIGNTELRVDIFTAAATPYLTHDAPGGNFGVLNNDSDPVEGDTIFVAGIVGCADVTAPFDCTTTNGGTVSMNADGTFSVTPLAIAASDSFQYQLSDGTDTTNSTVTINLKGAVWYVNADAPAGGNGTSVHPFNSFTALNGAGGAGDVDGAGAYIFVHAAAANLNGSIELEAGQHLLGEAVALSVDPGASVNGVSGPFLLRAAGSRPSVTHTGDAVVINGAALPVEVRGLALSSSGGNAIDLTASSALAGASSLLISDNNILASGSEGFDINFNAGTSGSLPLTIANNVWIAGGPYSGNAIDIAANAGTLQLVIDGNDVSSNGANAIAINGTSGNFITVTSFQDNSVAGDSSGSGINANYVTFDQVPGGGYDAVSGGLTTIGTSGNGVGAAGMVLSNVQGNLAFSGLEIYADNGTGLNLLGSGSMTLSVADSGAVVSANGGAALDLSTVQLDVTLGSLFSTNSLANGVSLTGITGQLLVTGGAITNPSSTDFTVNTSNANITYQGTITDDVGQLVAASNNTGGTIAFTGAISDGNDGDGAGVNLANNSGTTIRFAGGLLLSTGANAAFTASGGGTVEVCDENPCVGSATTGALVNSLTTTANTALTIINTNIGSNGLEFRSISASGGNNGIVLMLTGSAGGLSVKGTGTPGSGGTLANMTGGANGSTNGIGAYLNNTQAVSLNWMQLNDFSNFAIWGNTVTGFTLNNSVINGSNGNSTGDNEGSITFENLLGSATLMNTAISGGYEDNFRMLNSSGVLDRLVFNGVNIGPNDATVGNDGITLEVSGNATANVTVQGSIFTSARGDLFQLNLLETGVSDLIFSGNTLSNNHPAIATGGGGVTIISGNDLGGSTLTYDISGNTFRDAVGGAVLLVKSTDTGTTAGSFSNNTIGASGVTKSGSLEGGALKVQSAGKGNMVARVSTNQLSHFAQMGMEYLTGGGAIALGGNFDMTVVNNTVKNNDATDGLPYNGIHLNGGTVPGDTYAICMDVGGSGLTNDPVGSGVNGATDIRLRQRQDSTVRLPGYGGAATDAAAVESYLIGRNQAGSSALASINSTGFNGGAACTQP